MKYSLFIFTRDFRLKDNIALNSATETVLPIFIFDPRQVSEMNKYRSDKCVQFMIYGLRELSKQISAKGGKLRFFHGKPGEVLKGILKGAEILEVVVSADYSPFAKKRQKELETVCKKHDIPFNPVHNHMLVHGILKPDGEPYVKYTPYYNVAKKKVMKPEGTFRGSFGNVRGLSGEYKGSLDAFHSGELSEIPSWKTVKKYGKTRNLLGKSTTGLSPYLKFGLVSPRVVWADSGDRTFRKQLIWRDFYMQLLDHFPGNLGHDMRKIKGHRGWKSDPVNFKRWKEGKTGVPLVDAGMREMNQTGYMHNRARLVVADYLVKHLGIDWKQGEKYFARKLVDYDISNNNGNWQWIAGTGVDSQPYYRTFNPELQAKRYDPDMSYINKWTG